MFLVRHGQSEWNAVGRWQGQADPPLSEVGRRQGAIAAKKLSGFHAVVASPLQRALETAETIAKLLDLGPVLTEPGLIERDAGPWQGLTRVEIEDRWPGFLDRGDRPDGYEPNVVVLERTRKALDRIVGQVDGSTVLIVTHAGVIYTLEESFDEPIVRIPNLGGRWFDLLEGDLRLGNRVDVVPEGTVPELL